MFSFSVVDILDYGTRYKAVETSNIVRRRKQPAYLDKGHRPLVSTSFPCEQEHATHLDEIQVAKISDTLYREEKRKETR